MHFKYMYVRFIRDALTSMLHDFVFAGCAVMRLHMRLLELYTVIVMFVSLPQLIWVCVVFMLLFSSRLLCPFLHNIGFSLSDIMWMFD